MAERIEGFGNIAFQVNRDDSDYFLVDEQEAGIDALETAALALDRSDKLKWHWVSIALDLAIYRFAVANLTAGDSHNVIASPGSFDDGAFLLTGTSTSYLKSRRIKNENGWGYKIAWEHTTDRPPDPGIVDPKDEYKHRSGELISFWVALSRVQDPIFYMGRFFKEGRPLLLTETELESIAFVHNAVRNQLAHFKPSSHRFHIGSIKMSCRDVLRPIEFLALNYPYIAYSDFKHSRRRIEAALSRIQSEVGAIRS